MFQTILKVLEIQNMQNQAIFDYTPMIINQNILAILTTFLNLQKKIMKNSTPIEEAT